MKKKRITYGVRGMMEYQAVVKVGKKSVNILFSDGSVSAMGTNPATFTTDNIIIQIAIENSNDFKRGRIEIVNTIELDEELKVVRPKPAAIASPKHGAEQQRTAAPADPVADEAQNPTLAETTADEDKTSDESKTDDDNDEDQTPAPTEDKQESVANMTQVEFSCNDDAKDYLEQNFGLVRSKLRNRDDIINAGKTYNVEIIFV